MICTVPIWGSEVANSKTEIPTTNTASEVMWCSAKSPLLNTRGRVQIVSVLKRTLDVPALVNMQQMNHDDFCRQIFRVLTMDASVPVDSRMYMPKRRLWKYLADSGLTEVVSPDGRQYTLKHGKVLVEETSAGIEPLEFNRKVERKMRFDLVLHDPDGVVQYNCQAETGSSRN